MNDLDTALRHLADDLGAAPYLPADEIRRRGTARRRRRHTALGASAAVTTVAAVVGLSLWAGARPTASTDPAGTPTTATGPTQAPPIAGPGGYLQVHEEPALFTTTGDEPTGGLTQVTAQAIVARLGPCLVLAPDGDLSGAEAMPRALVFPVGTVYAAGRGGAVLPDGDFLPPDTRVTATALMSARGDDTFAQACPGTSGYVVLPGAGTLDIGDPGGAGSGSGSPSSTPSAEPSASAGWVTAIPDDFPIATGLEPTAEETAGPATRTLTDPLLEPCQDVPAQDDSTDGLEYVVSGPATTMVRQLRLYPDAEAAAAALDAWRDAFTACSGAVSEGTPALEHEFDVTQTQADRLVVGQIVTDPGGQPYPWGSHLGVVRVGNAVLAVATTTEETGSAEAVQRWSTADGETLTALAPTLCAFDRDGTSPAC